MRGRTNSPSSEALVEHYPLRHKLRARNADRRPATTTALNDGLRPLLAVLIGLVWSVPACGARSGLGAPNRDRTADSGVPDARDAGHQPEGGRADDDADDAGLEASTLDAGPADSGFVATIEVAASAVNSYFLTPDGGVKSCGENAAGQLGDGTFGPPTPKPGNVIGLT